jgi:hypothetical protein
MRVRADGKIELDRASVSSDRSTTASAATPAAALAPDRDPPPRLAAADPAQAQQAAAVAAQLQPRRAEPAPGLLSRAAQFLGLGPERGVFIPGNGPHDKEVNERILRELHVDPALLQQPGLAAQRPPGREEPAPGLLNRAAHFLGLGGPNPATQRYPSNAILLPPGAELNEPTMSKEMQEALRRLTAPRAPLRLPVHRDGSIRITHPRSIIGVRG